MVTNSDVLIVGGGVIGLSIARELYLKGVRRITVLEKGLCGQEASRAAAGMLGPQAETGEFGPFYEMCCASRDLYPDFAAGLMDETGVDIELERSGTLSLAFDDDESDVLMRRYNLNVNAGQAVKMLSQEELLELEPCLSTSVRFGLLFAHDWQVENRHLMTALGRFAKKNAIDVRENTPVTHLMAEDGRVSGIETHDGTLRADHTILATGAWTSLIKPGLGEISLKVEPVRGQMLCFRPERQTFTRVIYGRGGYLVPRADGRVLAGSTTEHVGFEKSVTSEARERLLSMAGEISPFLAGCEIEDHWAGLRPFAPDGLPLLGPMSETKGLFVATAHYRNGILLAPLTARLAAEYVVNGTRSELFKIFGPDRFRLRGVGTG